MNIDINQIMQLIPHRYPFLLIDRILDITLGERATALKNVTINEPFFNGHFPGHPIMPGVLILEAMAQTSAVLMVESMKGSVEDSIIYLTSVENAVFRKTVTPGDSMHLEVSVIKTRSNFSKMYGSAIVNDEKVAEANFSAMLVKKTVT